MGIVNVTPDSFSDGGRHAEAGAAVAHGVALWSEGADWLDVGGESTRPGAEPVPVDEELRRVVPVIAGLRAAVPDAVLSIDTRRAAVAEAALGAGASVVNDVSACADPAMAGVVARAGAWLVLMHMRGDPSTMQQHTDYADLVGEVGAHLAERAAWAVDQGVRPERIVLDAGLGFGKALADNPRLIAATPALRALGFPVMVGASRKRFIGALTGVQDASARVFGSVGAACAAMAAGADILRVHDVAATIQALRVMRACEHA